MSYFKCPHCSKPSYIFGKGGARKTADEMGLGFVGEVLIVTVDTDTDTDIDMDILMGNGCRYRWRRRSEAGVMKVSLWFYLIQNLLFQ